MVFEVGDKDPGEEDPEDNSDILDSPTHIHAVGDAFVIDGFSEELEIIHLQNELTFEEEDLETGPSLPDV